MSYPGITPSERDIGRIASVVYGHHTGRMNVVGSVTLTAGATTTTVTDLRIGGASVLLLTPRSATAAIAPVYVSAKGKGTATLTHDNTADTDRTFDVVILG